MRNALFFAALGESGFEDVATIQFKAHRIVRINDLRQLQTALAGLKMRGNNGARLQLAQNLLESILSE